MLEIVLQKQEGSQSSGRLQTRAGKSVYVLCGTVRGKFFFDIKAVITFRDLIFMEKGLVYVDSLESGEALGGVKLVLKPSRS